MKTRNIYPGKAHAMSKGQSGSGQIDKSVEVFVGHIPVGNGKEVTVSQIVDKSLLDNEDNEREDSVPPRIQSETLPTEKWLTMPSIEPKCLKRGKTDTLPTITDRQEIVEREQDKEILYCKPR